MYLRFKFLLISILLSCIQVSAQTQLTDFRPDEGDGSSTPSRYAVFNDQMIFQAYTEDRGLELYISQGDASSTRLLKDICPGKCNGISQRFSYAIKENSETSQDEFFFIASDGEHRQQLWSTKGSETTTTKVVDLPEPDASNLILVGDQLFFLIYYRNKNTIEVWKSDGTASGTIVVTEINSIWNTPGYVGTVNNLFFFALQPEGYNSLRMWRSDGTAEGTFPVTQEIDGNGTGVTGTSDFTQYITYKDELYFVIRSSSIFSFARSVGLMKTDGSLANTVPVKAMHEGNQRLIDFTDVIKVNDKLYFSFFEADYNRLFIWESDGTDEGTKKIYDETGDDFFIPSYLSTDGSNLIFTGKGEDGHTALLKIELDNYEVTQITELTKNAQKPSIFTSWNVNKIFPATDSTFLVSTRERYGLDSLVWFSNISSKETVVLESTRELDEALHFNDEIYFILRDPIIGTELWKSDPALMAPELVINLNDAPNGLLFPYLTVLSDQLIFSAGNKEVGYEPWIFDLTTDQLTLLTDINTGEKNSYPNIQASLNGAVYFTAYTPATGRELWRTDGTEEGTWLVQDINPGSASSSPRKSTVVKDKVYFVVRIERFYYLYSSDGQTAEMVYDPGANIYNVPLRLINMVSSSDKLYFTTTNDGEDVYRSDGTEEGTFKIKDFGKISELVVARDGVYFAASKTYNGPTGLWYSLSSSDEVLPIDISAIEGLSDVSNLMVFNDLLVFTGYSTEYGKEFFTYNPSTQQAKLLADIHPGSPSSIVSTTEHVVSEQHLYFTANNGEHGTELWRTDGSLEGTEMVSDINTGSEGSFPKHLINHEGKIYFSAFSEEYGQELWVSDGNTSTTDLLLDIAEGPGGSVPEDLSFAEGKLFFTAITIQSGRQLYRYDSNSITAVEYNREEPTRYLYPNPAFDYVTVGSATQPVSQIRVYDLYGRELSVKIDSSQKIYIGHLESGVYIIEQIVDQKRRVGRFIKQ